MPNQTFTDAMPDTSSLPRYRVTPEVFEQLAEAARWRPKTIECFLKRPYCKEYVAVGDAGKRAMLRVVAPTPVANNPTAI